MEIEPCFHCGDLRDVEIIAEGRIDHIAHPSELYRVYKVRCKFCGNETGECRDLAEAVKMWNRRNE